MTGRAYFSMKWNRKYLYPVFVFVLFMLFSNNLFLNIFSAANEKRAEWFSAGPIDYFGDFKNFSCRVEVIRLSLRQPILIEKYLFFPREEIDAIDILIASKSNVYIIEDTKTHAPVLVSPNNIRDGLYEVAIRLRKGGGESSVIRTRCFLRVSNSKFYEYYSGFRKKMVGIPESSEQIRYSLAEFSFAAGRITAAGWAYIRGRETRNQEVYLSVIDEHGKEHTYISSKGFRPDVGQAFDNSHYNHSGFRIDVPAGDLRGEVRSARIIIEDEGLFQVSVPIPGKGMSEEQSPRVELDHVPLHSEDVVYNIDVFEKGEDGASIRGWGYLKGRETAGQRVYLLLVDKTGRKFTYLSRPVSRPDVAEAFGDPRYKESGFSFYIKDSRLNVHFHKARLIIENEGLYKTGEFQLKR